VHDYLKDLIAEVSSKCYEDIRAGKDPHWRMEELEKIVAQYTEMVFCFWKPIKSFYKEEIIKIKK